MPERFDMSRWCQIVRAMLFGGSCDVGMCIKGMLSVFFIVVSEFLHPVDDVRRNGNGDQRK